MHDTIQIRGIIRAILRDQATGRVKSDRTQHNIITNAGRAHIIDRLQAASAAVADYIAIGTSTAAVAAADTTLAAEVARAQGALTQPDAYTDRCTWTFPAGTGTGNISEFGRLNAGTGGTLMGHAVHRAVISASSVANPTEITTATAHGLTTGDTVVISGHSGSTPDINGPHVVTVTGANTFTIAINVTTGGTGGLVVATSIKGAGDSLEVRYDFTYAAG
jgi:hypothetical protein